METPTGLPEIIALLSSDAPNGTVPFQANLTVDAKAFDADGNEISADFSWEIRSESVPDLAEIGAEVPSTVAVNLTVPGEHTFIVTVSAKGFPDVTATTTVTAEYPPIVLAFDGGASANVAEPYSAALSITGGLGTFTCSWEGDIVWDDASSCSPGTEFSSAGSASATVTVTDGISSETLALTLDVGLPKASGTVTGSIFAYNQPPGCVGVSNVIATATGPAGDPVPKFPAGTSVCLSGRSVSKDGLKMEMYIFDGAGNIFDGPFAMDDSSPETLGGGGFAYGGPDWSIPATAQAGTYYIGLRFPSGGGYDWLQDTSVPSPEGHKTIEVLGSPI